MFMIKQRYALFLILKIVLLILIGHQLHLFKKINTYLYQQSSPLLHVPNTKHQAFTLIDASTLSSLEVTRMIEKIHRQNPKMLIADIFHTQENFSVENRQTLLNLADKTLFTALLNKKEIDKITSFWGKAQSDSLKNSIGFYSLYPIDISLEKEKYPHLIHFFQPNLSWSFTQEQERINYNGLPSFGQLYGSDILNGNSISELFENKIVIVSNFNNTYLISNYSTLLGQPFLHQKQLAFMLKSAYTQSWLEPLALVPYSFYILLFIIAIMGILYKFFYHFARYVILLALLIPLSIYWIGISYFSLLLPVSEMIFISLVLSFYLFLHWKELREEEEKKILLHLSSRLKTKVVLPSFFNSQSAWEELISMINQIFTLKKNILFEKIEGDTRIHEIASFNCTFEDIGEMRRDYTREPYNIAIETKALVQPTRKFFTSLDDGDSEFIMPLLYYNEIVGFWAFSLSHKEQQQIEHFFDILTLCGKELGRLVYERKRYTTHKKENKNSLKKQFKYLLNLEIRNNNLNSLKEMLSVSDKKVFLTEILLDTIHTNVIVYDFFGKIMQINQKMSRLLEQENIKIYNFTANEMLSHLIGISLEDATRLVRDITFTKKSHKEFIYFKESQKRYLLMISPITKDAVSNKFSANYFLETFGLVFEFIDFTLVEHHANLRENIILNAVEQNRTRLSLFKQILSSYIDTSNTQAPKLQSQLQEVIEQMFKGYHAVEKLMKEGNHLDSTDIYPLNIMTQLQSLCDEMGVEFRKKSITYTLRSFETLVLCMASVKDIYKTLKNLLIFLTEDSQTGGEIEIDVENHTSYIKIKIQSFGVGMPDSQLTEYINKLTPTQEYVALQESQKNIRSWGGEVLFDSAIGEGIGIEVSLKSLSL